MNMICEVSEIRYIYSLRSSSEPERIRYIGQTHDTGRRIKEHISLALKNSKCRVHKWMKKYISLGNEIKLVVEFASSVEKINELECDLISYFGSEILNLKSGGWSENVFLMSDEQKISHREKTKQAMLDPAIREKLEAGYAKTRKPVLDSLGNKFLSLNDAAKFHNLSGPAIQNRIKLGKSSRNGVKFFFIEKDMS